MTQPYALISRRRNRAMKIAVGVFVVFTVFVMLFSSGSVRISLRLSLKPSPSDLKL